MTQSENGSSPVDRYDGLDTVLGLQLHELSADVAVASFEIGPQHRQRFGIVHGGTYAAIAEFLASEGTVHGVSGDGQRAVGSSNHTMFLRPLTEGVVHATGRPRHRGRKTWLWEIDFQDERGRLCATARVMLATLPAPDGAPEPLSAPRTMGALP